MPGSWHWIRFRIRSIASNGSARDGGVVARFHAAAAACSNADVKSSDGKGVCIRFLLSCWCRARVVYLECHGVLGEGASPSFVHRARDPRGNGSGGLSRYENQEAVRAGLVAVEQAVDEDRAFDALGRGQVGVDVGVGVAVERGDDEVVER